jgi:hypothetical protein
MVQMTVLIEQFGWVVGALSEHIQSVLLCLRQRDIDLGTHPFSSMSPRVCLRKQRCLCLLLASLVLLSRPLYTGTLRLGIILERTG